MKHESNTDAAAEAPASAAAPGFTVRAVISRDAAVEAAAPATASVLISCFIFILNFESLIFDLNFDLDLSLYFCT